VSWITDDWRLKLLALGLAVLMLGAVAFSQNPPTSKTFTKNIDIIGAGPAGLVVINPPTKTTVTVTGLADTILSVTSSSVVASIDVSKATPGPSVKVNLVVRALVAGVTVVNPILPEALNINQRAQVTLPVLVRTPRVTPGWQITKAEARCPATPCSVIFDGPTSLETNLKAYADFTSPVENSSYDVLTQPVLLEQNGAPVELVKLSATMVPAPTLDISTVSIHVEAKTGTTSRQVVLIDSPPSQPPPTCYRVTNVTVDPISVVLTGPPDVLARISTIALPGVDLSAKTSDASFKVTIPYPELVNGSAATARVTYSISKNPSCAPPSP
jgi:YbbR domain-containing protein